MNDGPSGMVVAWQRWRALPPADRRLAAALVALLPAVAAGLRVLGFGRLCRVLSRLSTSETAIRIARAPGCPEGRVSSEVGRLGQVDTSPEETRDRRDTLASRDRSPGIPNRGLPSSAFPVSLPSTPAAEAAVALGRLVNAVAWRLPGRPACLTRSVTLWWLLRRRGIEAAVRIGVRRADGRLEAHAWVELDGLILNDAQDIGSRFAAFEGDTLPASWANS